MQDNGSENQPTRAPARLICPETLPYHLQQTQQHTTTHTNASLPDAGMPPRKGKGGGRIRRAFARAKSRARVAAQSAKERVKQAPRNIGELIKVYGRTALLTYIAVDVCTYV